MAESIQTYKTCPRCKGTGDPGIITDSEGNPVETPVCPTCGGEKYVPNGLLS